MFELAAQPKRDAQDLRGCRVYRVGRKHVDNPTLLLARCLRAGRKSRPSN
jgi:hypothetical protein